MFRLNPYGESPAERLDWLCYRSGGDRAVMARFLAQDMAREADLAREEEAEIAALKRDVLALKHAVTMLRRASLARAIITGQKYDPNQPRDDHGRWTSGDTFGIAPDWTQSNQDYRRMAMTADVIYKATKNTGIIKTAHSTYSLPRSTILISTVSNLVNLA